MNVNSTPEKTANRVVLVPVEIGFGKMKQTRRTNDLLIMHKRGFTGIAYPGEKQ